MAKSFFRSLIHFLLRRAGLVVTIGLVLGSIGAYYSVRLYMNLRTNVEELLPTTARSVLDLGEVTTRLEAFENLVILVFSDDPKASKKFVIDFATELSKTPKNIIASVEYRIDHEMEWFKARKALYVDSKDLTDVRNYIRERLEYEKALRNPFTILANLEIPEPMYDFGGLRGRYQKKTGGFEHLPGGFYATPDEKMRLLVVYQPGNGMDGAVKLKKAILDTMAKVDPKKYGADIEIKYTGNIENMLEETAALMEDLELSTVLVIILCTIAMIYFYKSVIGTFALTVALFIGTFWTFGGAYFAVGYLNANTAFLASIVLGNGINFGIIFLARYLEERQRGYSNLRAVRIATGASATATLTAALAAGMAYGSLMLTSFRGFNQFGVIGLMGMIFCWTATYGLLPPIMILLNRIRPIQVKPVNKNRWTLAGWIAIIVDRHPTAIWRTSVALAIIALCTLPLARNGVIETDLSKLRDKTSMTKGAGALYHYIDDVFKKSVSPMVILPKSREDAREIAKRLRDVQTDDEEFGSVISSIQVMDDFLPQNQERKIALLKEIRTLLPDSMLRHLSSQERKMAQEFFNPAAFKPFALVDLPELVRSKFREKDGTLGNMVLMDKKIHADGLDSADELRWFVSTGRRIADSVRPGTPVAGGLPISFDMYDAIVQDGPKATLFAFLAVIGLVVILFRRLSIIVLCLFALMIGMVWMAGLMLGTGLKINFLNFIALPITFGIGIDYGVNVFQRYMQEGDRNIVDVIRTTGGAVMLASLTTIIGYGSLLIAGNQAFVSFGKLSIFGEITCVVAAVVTLPAYLRHRANKRDLLLANQPLIRLEP